MLRHLAGQYQERFELEAESDLYLRMTLRPEKRVSEAEARQVYRQFFFGPDGSRRDTGYVYLNVYDASDRFIFQLFYDPAEAKVIRGAVERY